MNIYRDIMKAGRRVAQSRAGGQLKVVDTLQIVLRELSGSCKGAQVLDASALLEAIEEVYRYTYYYENGMDYGNIAPVYPSMWIELADLQTAVNFAAFSVYTENHGQAELAGQARKHNIRETFHWCCKTRCFIKRANGKTLPLKWEWIEYVGADGHSVGGLMQSVGLPAGLEQLINDELAKLQFVQPDLCALIAHWGLYTIDMLNHHIATLQLPSDLRTQPAAGRKQQVNHHIVKLNFKTGFFTAPASKLQG